MNSPRIETDPFRVGRTELALLCAQMYLRWFWWIAVPPLLVGPWLLFNGVPALRALGAFCLAWPLTIVGRGFFISNPVARRMLHPTRLVAEGDTLTFHADHRGGGKLRIDEVRRLRRVGRLYVMETRRLGFAVVPTDAFRSDADRRAFEALFEEETHGPD